MEARALTDAPFEFDKWIESVDYTKDPLILYFRTISDDIVISFIRPDYQKDWVSELLNEMEITGFVCWINCERGRQLLCDNDFLTNKLSSLNWIK